MKTDRHRFAPFLLLLVSIFVFGIGDSLGQATAAKPLAANVREAKLAAKSMTAFCVALSFWIVARTCGRDFKKISRTRKTL